MARLLNNIKKEPSVYLVHKYIFHFVEYFICYKTFNEIFERFYKAYYGKVKIYC